MCPVDRWIPTKGAVCRLPCCSSNWVNCITLCPPSYQFLGTKCQTCVIWQGYNRNGLPGQFLGFMRLEKNVIDGKQNSSKKVSSEAFLNQLNLIGKYYYDSTIFFFLYFIKPWRTVIRMYFLKILFITCKL